MADAILEAGGEIHRYAARSTDRRTTITTVRLTSVVSPTCSAAR
jgi:hypothetical protein